MTLPPDADLPDIIRYYHTRARQYATRIGQATDPEALLAQHLAPDMEPTGFHLAVAMGFAARALCPPAGRTAPDIPDPVTLQALHQFGQRIAVEIADIQGRDLTETVTHAAGSARLTQRPGDYILRFALPNLVFHLSLTHAALRQGRLTVGKADFDGLHRYP
ncbi:MAG: DUF1993 family protein [Pseudomonadota bacterium]